MMHKFTKWKYAGNSVKKNIEDNNEILNDPEELGKRIDELKEELKVPAPGFLHLSKGALLVNLLVIVISLIMDLCFHNLLSFSPINESIDRSGSPSKVAAPEFFIPEDLHKNNKIVYNKTLDRLELNERLQNSEKDLLVKLNQPYQKEIEKLWSRSHPFGDIDFNPANGILIPIPILAYLIFLAVAFRCYLVMENEYRLNRIPDPDALEEIEGSYNNLIDIIGFGTPLLGAAILLLSVLVGSWLFVNFSVPFEIKAIMVLVLSKSFTMVTDKVTDEYRTRIYKKIKIKELEDALKELRENLHKNIAVEREKEIIKREQERRAFEEEQMMLLRTAMLANLNYDPAILDSFERAIKNNALFTDQISSNLKQIAEISSHLEKAGKITQNFLLDLRPFYELTNTLISGLKDQEVQKSLQRLTSFAKSLSPEMTKRKTNQFVGDSMFSGE
ncbi:MAG: hypothetical protein Q8858_01235 [Bacteroidota bacterium]|nr:hypothetical protein [Bacteroidota bacterium]